jgi:putative ABC transport system permease protein
MFSVIDGVILRPLPYSHPDRIMLITGAAAPPTGDWLTWWRQSKAFAELALYSSGGANLTGGSQPERVTAAVVSASFFAVFEVRPALGHAFMADEEAAGRNQVALLSHRLWIQDFGGDPQILGKTIALNSRPYLIVGVLPSGFDFPGHTDLWVPRIVEANSVGRDSLDLGPYKQADVPAFLEEAMLGRLHAGATLAQARSELNVLLYRLTETYTARTGIHFGVRVGVIPLQEVLVSDFRPALYTLFAGVSFLLLVACLNAANILLARAAARQKEVAVRLCLGASRMRIVRHLITESLLLTFCSGLLGILFAFWIVEAIRAIGPAEIPRLGEISVDLRVLGFTVVACFVTGTLIGLAPALESLAPDITASLKEEGFRSASRLPKRVRSVLVAAEIGLALVLLTGAGLMIRSFDRLTRVEPGFEPHNLVTLELSLPKEEYAPATAASQLKAPQSGRKTLGATTTEGKEPEIQNESLRDPDARVAAFYRRLTEAVGRLPGVTAAGMVSSLPLSGETEGSQFLDLGGKLAAGQASVFVIGGNYFRALGAPLLAGRPFRESDSRDAPRVVVINQNLARQFWGAKNPLGAQFVIEGEEGPREIVGVVGDVKFSGLGEQPGPQLYLPYTQPYDNGRMPLSMAFVVRTDSNPQSMVPGLRRQVLAIDKELPVFHVNTMEELVYESTSAPRFRGLLLGTFAFLALVLAVAGVYGVVAQAVVYRTHEIGVRVSLGATPHDILRLIVGQGARLALWGVALGLIAAFGLTRLVSSLLFGISPTDLVTYVAVSVSLIAAALLASYLPARRATKIDPMAALRYE